MTFLYISSQFPGWIEPQLLTAISSSVMYSLLLVLVARLTLPVPSFLLPGITSQINDLYPPHSFASAFKGTQAKAELKVVL